MPASSIARASFGWLADRQLLMLHDHYLDEALQRLSPDGTACRRSRHGAICSSVPSADVAELVRQDPAGLFDLLRDCARRRQAEQPDDGRRATAAT